MTDPTAIPAVMPFPFAPVETDRITNISSQVRNSSRKNDWAGPPAGTVAPRLGWAGNSRRRQQLASTAPSTWQPA